MNLSTWVISVGSWLLSPGVLMATMLPGITWTFTGMTCESRVPHTLCLSYLSFFDLQNLHSPDDPDGGPGWKVFHWLWSAEGQSHNLLEFWDSITGLDLTNLSFQLEELFEAHPPTSEESWYESLHITVKANIAWREANEEAILDWLSAYNWSLPVELTIKLEKHFFRDHHLGQ